MKSRGGGGVLRFDGVGIKTSTEVFLSPATTYSSLRYVRGASPSPHTMVQWYGPKQSREKNGVLAFRESGTDFTG